MSIDWQEVKTSVWHWYMRVSAFWMLQTVMAYLWACMVAGKPVGPVETVHFVNHTTIWRPLRAASPANAAGVAPGTTAAGALPRQYLEFPDK
jgi:hypothetical protein